MGGGGVDGSPGGGTGGGVGCLSSGRTQADRSKNRNSSALACGDISLVLHPLGNGLPGSESSPPVVRADVWTDFWMWMSVKTTFPHCIASGVPTGVLKLRYCDERGDE